MFLAEIIQLLVNKMWFRDKDDEGVVHPEFSEGRLLSRVTVALVLTAVHLLFFFQILLFMLILFPKVHCALDEWATGEQKDVPFRQNTYSEKFDAHLKRLENFEKKTASEKIVPRLLKHMLKVAR
jgi:hypothetical protein